MTDFYCTKCFATCGTIDGYDPPESGLCSGCADDELMEARVLLLKAGELLLLWQTLGRELDAEVDLLQAVLGEARFEHMQLLKQDKLLGAFVQQAAKEVVKLRTELQMLRGRESGREETV